MADQSKGDRFKMDRLEDRITPSYFAPCGHDDDCGKGKSHKGKGKSHKGKGKGCSKKGKGKSHKGKGKGCSKKGKGKSHKGKGKSHGSKSCAPKGKKW